MLNFVYFLPHQHWTVWDRDLYHNLWSQCINGKSNSIEHAEI